MKILSKFFAAVVLSFSAGVFSVCAAPFEEGRAAELRALSLPQDLSSGIPAATAPRPDLRAPLASLRVTGYNVKGMPSPLAENGGRYGRIAALLRDQRSRGVHPQVLLLQEAFVKPAREIAERAGYPYVYYGAGKCDKDCHLADAGLVLASDFPILDHKTVSFGMRNCSGLDCFANKGAAYLRVAVPGAPAPVDIFTSHMNANSGNDPEKAELARHRQIDVIASFIEAVRPGPEKRYPMIVAGDLNMKPSRDNWEYLLARTATVSTGRFCLDDARCGIEPGTPADMVLERTNDQHLFSYSPEQEGVLIPVRFARGFRADQVGEELSDHFSYDVTYELYR